MAPKQNKTIIHIKLDQAEALDSKRALLSTQLNSIKLVKIMKRYWLLRSQECSIKQQTEIRIKTLKKFLSQILQQLPEPEIPEILKKGREKHVWQRDQEEFEEDEQDRQLEKELKEIQEKLAALQE